MDEGRMTESEWLSCTDPTPMLELLRGKASDRKLRLFACACCRRIWRLLKKRSRKAVEVAEHHADGFIEVGELGTAYAAAYDAYTDTDGDSIEELAAEIVTEVVGRDAWNTAISANKAADVVAHVTVYGLDPSDPPSSEAMERAYCAARFTERAWQCCLLRCFIGNPFHSVPRNASWRAWNDGTIPKIAQAIYDERAFDRMPILADALEEAGCTDADILAHCRSGGEHVRGCWVVDLILGRP
jgi:hypothetical protein